MSNLSKRLDSLEQETQRRAALKREREAHCADASARLKAKLDQVHERLIAANGGEPPTPATPEQIREVVQEMRERLARGREVFTWQKA